MKSSIYVVTIPSKPKYAEGESINVKYDENQIERCPKCGQSLSGMKWVGEKQVSINKKVLPDFLYLYGGSSSGFLVSEKALNCLLNNGILGIKSYEKVDHFFIRKTEKIISYYDISVQRLNIPIDHEKSEINYGQASSEKKCDLCNPTGSTKDFIFHLYLKSDDAPDCDIFNIYEMGTIVFVSEQFIQICEANNLSGLSYEHIHDYDSNARELFDR